MIRRAVQHNNSSLPQRLDDKELDSSTGSSFDQNGMDRSIHSIEEGTEQEENHRQRSADYNAHSMPRGDGHANRRPPSRGDGDMDDSSHSTSSSLGKQSSFIQQRIDQQKKQGKWINVTLHDSDSTDDEQNHNDVENDTDTVLKNDECPDALPRTPSLVCMLKMEPISEKEVLRNSWNDQEDDETSVVSDVSGISNDAGFIGDMDIPDPPLIDDGRRRSSFLPNVDTERFVEVEITPMVKAKRERVTSQDTGDSETFMFTSINSADNMTHVSDAPDYDYNSDHGKQNNISSKNEERIPPPARSSYKQKFISPMERKRSLQERAHARNEVLCEVLGLPKDKPRKIHRGIMSRDTELKLRALVGDDSDSTINAQDNPSINQNETSALKLPLPWRAGTDLSSGDSDESSIDLAFEVSQEKKSNRDDKWERVRSERQISRQSLASSSATTKSETKDAHDTNGTSVTRAKDDDLIQEQSWHSSFHWIKDLNPISNPEDEGPSLIGKIYNRFQQPHHDADDHATISSSGSSCSDNSSDDEGNTWDMNIMTEGQYYLSMSMLVYVYGLLRQTSLLGHTEISFDEVDVNSSQAESRRNKSHRYLNNTKSAGFIIRVVMDELEKKGAFSDVEKEGDMR